MKKGKGLGGKTWIRINVLYLLSTIVKGLSSEIFFNVDGKTGGLADPHPAYIY
jgi:hypothetical protein